MTDTLDEPDNGGRVASRVCDPVTGWDRVSVIEALTMTAQRLREAEVDQLVLIARAAQVWTWIDNLDGICDQMTAATRIPDEATADAVQAAADVNDQATLDNVLGPGGRTHHTGSSSSAEPAAGVLHGERLRRYGAEGTPEVSEFLRLEIGPALGVSPERAAGLIGDVLDLRHRLPGLWAHLENDQIRGWVACQVARKTRIAKLSPALCGELDRRIAPFAPGWTEHKILTMADRLIVLLDPDTAEARRREALGRRYVDFWTDRHPDGPGR